jgi:hypothetical protein
MSLGDGCCKQWPSVATSPNTANVFNGSRGYHVLQCNPERQLKTGKTAQKNSVVPEPERERVSTRSLPKTHIV